MEEIKVVVQQEAACINFNYAEIKQQLTAQMEIYKGMEYTDDTIKDAKTDRATLNKLSKEIDDRRKAVKKEYNKPLDAFESQVKDLLSIINEPIKIIDSKVKDYENRCRAEKKAQIVTYWNEKVVQLPEELREKALNHLYDDRWENATTTAKAYKEAIDNGIAGILKDIETIKSMASEFEPEGISIYYNTFVLADAISKMNQLKAQREAILQKERERLEAEARAKAEAEARAKIEAEVRAEIQKEKEQETPAVREEQDNSAHESTNVDNVDKNVDNFGLNEPNPCDVDKSQNYYTIRIPADDTILNQIEEYLKFTDIPYEVMK